MTTYNQVIVLYQRTVRYGLWKKEENKLGPWKATLLCKWERRRKAPIKQIMGTEKQLIKLNILDGHLIHHVNFSNLSFSRYISHLAIEKSLKWPTYSIMSMANIFSFNLTQGLFGLTYSNKCWSYFKRNSLIILKTKFKIYSL